MEKNESGEHKALSPGWDSITAALEAIYGDQEPLHWGTAISYRLGGPDPLDGISAYRRSDPAPHWHFVTFGLSELYEKESDNADVSGFGFELTFRLLHSGNETQPPAWSLNFLQNLARYVFDTGNPFSPGHHMHLNGPIALDSDTRIRAIAFLHDPELPCIDTPNGRLEFVQVVGITEDEYLSMLRWDTDRFLDLLSQYLPLLLADIDRHCLLENPSVAAAIDDGVRTHGSSTGVLYTHHASCSQRLSLSGRRTTIKIDAVTAIRISLVLPGRLLFGNSLTISSPDMLLSFEPAESPVLQVMPENHILIGLSADAAATLAQNLGQRSGSYTIRGLSRLRFDVTPTLIRDKAGNIVERIE